MPDDELRTVADARLGRVLRGKYRLDRVLGVGGMAAVYAATHRNRKRFAIKMLHPELSVRESIRTRFLREGYVANTVDHPGAVAVLDDDVAEDGSAFLVMELLEGASLDAFEDRFEGRRLPVSLVVSVGDALLDVLAAAHGKGIVHRDLKPANVFLTNDGRLEVLDFGIARLHDETSDARHATQTGVMLGTPAFMAPEQALGESAQVDAQTDLWAVGATMFTLLSGALVHEATNTSQLVVRAATSKARPLASVAPGVPGPVAAVIDRALAFEKKERWESARAMRDALARACLEATGTPAAPLPKTERVTGLEATVASDPNAAPWSSNAGFEPTVDGNAAAASAPDAAPVAMSTAGGVVAPGTAGAHRSEPPPPKRRGRLLLFASGALVAALAGGLALRRVHDTPTALSVATPVPSAPRANRPPATPPAAAAYEAAIQALHDGNDEEAAKGFQAAIASDPSLAAAYLRLAIAFLGWRDAEAHVDYQKAVEHRATLGDVDAALLDAYEPRFRSPPDRVERNRRLLDVARRFPADPYTQATLGDALASSDRWAESDAAFERAIAIDPRYVPAYHSEAWNAFHEGDPATSSARARDITDRCLKALPTAKKCVEDRLNDDQNAGRCDDVEADARRMLAIDPTSHDGYWLLGSAMLARDQPLDSVLEALHQADAQTVDPTQRRSSELWTLERTRILEGDLLGADAALAESVDLASRARILDVFAPSIERVELALERGDGAAARTLVKKARALFAVLGTTDHDARSESCLALRSAQAQATTRDELHAEQARIRENQRAFDARRGAEVDPQMYWYWLQAPCAADAEDGREAVEALAPLGPLDRRALEDPDMAGAIGSVYALAGRYADAVPLLQRSVRACNELNDIGGHARRERLLGLSLEKTGDAGAAREAYGRVLARWGKAKPRSITAEAARAGLGRVGKGGGSGTGR